MKIIFVDGYNVINSWPNLNGMKEYSFDGARNKLHDILVNYASYNNCRIYLVFDGHKVAGNIEKVYDYRLLSRDHGEFEGLRRDEINLSEYWNIKKNIQYERAESVGSLFERVESLLRDIKIKYEGKNVLLVTHSGICRVLYYYFNGIPEDGNLLEYESHNCSFEQYDL